jgi:hypothetical protein
VRQVKGVVCSDHCQTVQMIADKIVIEISGFHSGKYEEDSHF